MVDEMETPKIITKSDDGENSDLHCGRQQEDSFTKCMSPANCVQEDTDLEDEPK